MTFWKGWEKVFINKNQKGYGWHSTVKNESISPDPMYINFGFKKGCDPEEAELSDGSLKCDLILKTPMGFRQVFPTLQEYNGRKWIEFKILELTDEPKPFRPQSDPKPTNTVQIEEGDLPFY